MLEIINDNNQICAIIIRRGHNLKDSIEFYTPDNFPLQLGLMERPKGYEIPRHVHIETVRTTDLVQEVLFVEKGQVEVTLYSDKLSIIEVKILNEGDIILLANGGHGFKILESARLFEVKQGPYVENKDKIRF